MSDWKATRWWRAIGPDGALWAESSNEVDVRGAARPGDRVQRLYQRIDEEWRDESAPLQGSTEGGAQDE